MAAMQGCHSNQLSHLRLLELSERLYPAEYRGLGLRLGVEETRLAHFERVQCGNIQQCIYQVLVDWTKREGSGATSHVLVQSLKHIGNQAAADWLQGEIDAAQSIAPQDDIDSMCTRGNVPSLPDCLTERPDELAEAKDKLRRLSSTSPPSSPAKTNRWLVIHGMGGMGKSVLVNQAIRDEELIKECFPDGVFWMPIGAAVKGDAQITERLETICRNLDDGLLMAPSPPKTKDQWKNLLNKLITQQYSRSLLVLDDVWEQDVVRAFEVKCAVVITTRDAGVHSCTRGRKEEVILSQGFTETQSLKAFSNWTDTPTCDLPPQAARIHQLSRGSPLVISIIGGLLREYGQRWEYYVTQLEEKNLKKLSTVRDAIHLSVEELPSRNELMRLFSWFAIFDQGTVLSSKILSMLEGCSTEEIEDQMRVLTQRHLAIAGCQSDDNCQTYWLHDLVYDYLVSETVDTDKDLRLCNEFKSLMVFNRFRLCRRDMIQTSLCLPQSSSVFQRARKACAAETSRNRFYVAEVVDTRPPVYSVTHRPAGKYATCAKLLPNGRDILTAGFGGQVQIANIVDGKARTLIHGHAENVTDLSMSSDGSLLATCSPTKGVCLWDFGRTDRLLPHVKTLTYEGQKVIRCSFVECGGETTLVSGDESGCLKVWSSSCTLRHSIQAHNTALMSCSTCDKEGAVVSCAKEDDTVRVFDVQSGSEKFRIPHVDDLRDCSFLSNGFVVTLTWCLLQIFTARGRRLCRWMGRESNVHFRNLSCADGRDGHYIAVRGVAGVITILKLGKMFPVTSKITTYYRLNVGGVYRDVINMWLECINGGASESGKYLVTNQSCGLILVWKLEKEESRPRIDGSVFDVSFKTDGSIRGLVGTKPRSPRTCQMLHPCCQSSLLKSATQVYKACKLDTISAIKIIPDHHGEILSCTTERIKVSALPRCFGNQSKRKVISSKRREFSVVPSQDKILLARLLGNDAHHLLTVSSGTGIALEVWSRDGTASDSRHIDFRQGLSADLSHDETKIAIGCSNSVTFLFSLAGPKIDDGEPMALGVEDCRVTKCVFSPNDQLLAVAGMRQITIFDVKNLTPVANCCEKSTISDVRFTPNNELLLIVAGGRLSLRETGTLCRRGKATAYAEVSDFQFSSDGTMLVTAGAVKYFDKGYLEWWRIDQSGTISQLQKFMLNSRVKRVVCNQYFTVFVTVDEVDEIYVLQRIPSVAESNST